MSPPSWLQYAYFAFLSRPAHDRAVYRAIRELGVRSIVELGVGTGLRARRMIALAQRYGKQPQVSYAGIDLFEARPVPGSGLRLKQAHQLLKATGAHVKLIPGDPLSALSRMANSLQSTDLVVVSGDQDEQSLEQAWFYVPRMLHEKSVVLVERLVTTPSYLRMNEREVEALANRTASTRRAA